MTNPVDQVPDGSVDAYVELQNFQLLVSRYFPNSDSIPRYFVTEGRLSIMPINRITLFKIPKPEDQDAALEAYRKLAAEQKKVVPSRVPSDCS